MAFKRSWPLLLLTILSVTSVVFPLEFDVPNLKTFTVKVRNDSISWLNVPWNDDGGQQEKVPAPDTTPSAPTTPYPSNGDCGVANWMDAGSSRIVGGMQTYPNEFPWQAFLKLETYSSKIFYCGGSLIDDRWILTTARCLLIPGESVIYITVYLGAHDITATYEANRKTYSGYEFVVHPEWNLTTMAGDIAMIHLSTTVTYTQYIRPICLASSNEPSYVNSQVTVAGWGTTFDGSITLSSLLRKVTVPVISNIECSQKYDIITNNVMCTSGTLGRGPCNGDAGGPMIYKQANGRWKQIGIVSFVSSRGCQSGYPYGYTRLSSYSYWVQNNIATYSGSASTPSSSSLLFLFLSLLFCLVNIVMQY